VNPVNGGWAILLTLIASLILAVVHLPEWWPQWLGWLRPNWVALTVFFWVLAVPQRFGLITAWLLGLLVDVLYGEPLGLNGALLAVFTYISWSLYERLRMFGALQQSILLFFMVLLAEGARMVGLLLLDQRDPQFAFLATALASAVVWPLLRSVLEQVQRACRVH
jgi:rod shape-determining protein MreD